MIINVASVSGYRGRPGLAAYVASKHGVIGLTKSLGVELGPAQYPRARPRSHRRRHARHSRSARRKRHRCAELARILDAGKAGGRRRFPCGRLGVPDDIARVALFCASDLSMLMTGSTLLVDAGALAN